MAFSLKLFDSFGDLRLEDFPSDEEETSDSDQGTDLRVSADDEVTESLTYLYKRLVDSFVREFHLREDAIKSAIEHLSYNYRHVQNGRTPSELDYNDMNNCVGYLYRFAACHADLVRDTINTIFQASPPPEITHILENSKLNVVFFGSGPGNDLVGFLSSLYGMHKRLTHLDVTAVDKMSGWAYIFEKTVQLLKQDICNGSGASRIFNEVSNITTSYVKADLEKSILWSGEMKTKLESADFVFLVKVLSNIPDTSKRLTLQKIVDLMKPGALLFFIDCPLPSKEFSAMSSCLRMIYETQVKTFHFGYKIERFGHENITICQAAVNVFVKQSSQQTEMPDLVDLDAWPALGENKGPGPVTGKWMSQATIKW